MKKIRIAIVCGLSNEMIREHLKLNDLKFANFLHSTILHRGKFGYYDKAMWVSNIIENCVQYEDVELHIIASQFGMKEKTQQFYEKGVSYYLFKDDKIFPYNYIAKVLSPEHANGYHKNRKIVHKLIDEISPDLIVLVGAENPSYSSTVLGINNIPVYVMCQTVVNNSGKECKEAWYNNILSLEKKIFYSTQYVGVYCKKHFDQLKSINYNGYIFEFQWPSIPLGQPNETIKKEYDFINFANRATDDKGYADSIKALAIVKKKYPNVTLNMLASLGPNTKSLEILIDELGLKDNIFFTPSFEKQSDVFEHIQKSRFAVLPCKLDNISGTMIQSMEYGLPIVVYETRGTPLFNVNKMCALIAKMNDIQDLANKMLYLLDHPEKAVEMKHDARKHVEMMSISRKHSMSRIVSDFKSIVAHYYNNTDIPEDLLFNTDIHQ